MLGDGGEFDGAEVVVEDDGIARVGVGGDVGDLDLVEVLGGVLKGGRAGSVEVAGRVGRAAGEEALRDVEALADFDVAGTVGAGVEDAGAADLAGEAAVSGAVGQRHGRFERARLELGPDAAGGAAGGLVAVDVRGEAVEEGAGDQVVWVADGGVAVDLQLDDVAGAGGAARGPLGNFEGEADRLDRLGVGRAGLPGQTLVDGLGEKALVGPGVGAGEDGGPVGLEENAADLPGGEVHPPRLVVGAVIDADPDSGELVGSPRGVGGRGEAGDVARADGEADMLDVAAEVAGGVAEDEVAGDRLAVDVERGDENRVRVDAGPGAEGPDVAAAEPGGAGVGAGDGVLDAEDDFLVGDGVGNFETDGDGLDHGGVGRAGLPGEGLVGLLGDEAAAPVLVLAARRERAAVGGDPPSADRRVGVEIGAVGRFVEDVEAAEIEVGGRGVGVVGAGAEADADDVDVVGIGRVVEAVGDFAVGADALEFGGRMQAEAGLGINGSGRQERQGGGDERGGDGERRCEPDERRNAAGVEIFVLHATLPQGRFGRKNRLEPLNIEGGGGS